MNTLKKMSISLFVPFFIFSSCTGMTLEDCEKGNWSHQGHRDATQGQRSENFERLKRFCEKNEYTASKEHYLKGYNQGIISFCTFKMGYKYGLKNSTYNDTCPKDLETDFYKGYTEGKKQNSLDSLHNKLNSQDDDDNDK